MVTRCWGSESELTKLAYAKINEDPTRPIKEIPSYPNITTIGQLKEEIIKLKLNGRVDSILLSAMTQEVRFFKEAMVIEEMNKMHQDAT